MNHHALHFWSAIHTAVADGHIPTSGTPYLCYEIGNPDASNSTATRLRITKSPGSVAASWWEFEETTASHTWKMTRSDDPVIETLVKPDAADANGQIVEERKKALADGTLVSDVITTYQIYPWGKVKLSEVNDPSGAALTTVWTYYANAATDGSNYKKLKQVTYPSGQWERYTYDSLNRLNKTVSSYLDTPPTADESSCRVITIAYPGDVAPAVDYSTTVETLQGTEIRRSYHRDSWDGYDDIVCQTPGAAINAADNLVTSTRNYLDSAFAGRIKSTRRPDGTGTLYSYSADNVLPVTDTTHATLLEDSTTLSTVIKEGQTNADGTDILQGTITATLTNTGGYVIGKTVQDTTSGLMLVQDTSSVMDPLGRPLATSHLNGTTTTRSYDCCRLASETDPLGITTSYEETASVHSTIRLGVTTKTTTTGLVTSTTRKGTDGTEIETQKSVLDVAGRIYSVEDGSHHPSTHAYTTDASGHQVETVTRPDGGTTVTKRFKDGSLLSITGTAALPVRYEYGVDAEGRFSKAIALDASGNDSGEWTRTTTDALGRTTHVRNAAGAHATATYKPTTGQLVQSVDPDGVTQLYDYDALGRRNVSAVDMNRDGVIDYNGSDRITRVTQQYASHGGVTVSKTTTETWNTDGADSPVALSVAEASVSGLQSWQTAAGLTASSSTSLSGGGAWVETTTAPDSSQTVRSYASGRLASEQRKDSSGAVIATLIYRYDVHGRLRQTEDGRGAQTDYAYDSADRVQSTTGPAPTAGGTRPITSVTYTSTGKQDTVTDTLGGTVTYTYWPTGAVNTVTGNRAYPLSYAYTAQGRMASMTTATGTTSWVYEASTGRLWKKLDATNKGEVYTYTTAGRLLTKTNARGAVATYGYTNAGQVQSVTYSDGTTPNVTNTFNRLGQPLTVASGGVTQTLGITPWGQLQTEAYAEGPLGGLAIVHGYDALLRRSSVAATLGASTLASEGFGYDGASRLSTVTGDNESATYGYEANADLLTNVTLKDGASLRMTTQRHFDLAGRLDSVKNLSSASAPLFTADYAHNTLNQRTGVTREDGTQWAWGYDDRGEVTSGGKKFSDGSAHPLLQFGYQYDAIGNRTQSTVASRSSTNSPNVLNQYSARTVPPYLSASGEAAADANVVVQAKPASRKGTAFWKEWNVDNATASVRENVRIAAAKPGAGAGGSDLASLQTGQLYLPPATESFTYDDDGNLTADSRWTYTWDAENRLLSMQENAATLPTGWQRQRLEFTYDAGSRRTRKAVKQWNGTAWATTADTAFVYDGWNLLAEVNILVPASPVVLRTYAWGLDLSQSLQGAGGVGGLLWARAPGTISYTHFAASDGNGNVIGYLDATTGQPVLKLDYDPFGVPVMVASTGTSASTAAARALPFRFSTKHLDRETGLDYYGYRYYAARLGRWINRDPLGERGGMNLYGFVGNSGTGSIDLWGLKASPYASYDPGSSEFTPSYSNSRTYQRDACGRLWVHLGTAHVWLRLSDEHANDPCCGKEWEIFDRSPSFGPSSPIKGEGFDPVFGPSGALRRDFMYRFAYAGYSNQNGLIPSEEGYAKTMQGVADFQANYGVIGEVYLFFGKTFNLGQGKDYAGSYDKEAEVIFVSGLEVDTGDAFIDLVGVGGKGSHGVLIDQFNGIDVKLYNESGDYTNRVHPIVLGEKNKIPVLGGGKDGGFVGGWATPDSAGAYFGANLPLFDTFFGAGFGFHPERLANLFTSDYWNGRTPAK